MLLRKTYVDLVIALALAACFLFLYAHFGLRLAQGIYFDYLNLGFDFDPPYFINYLVGSLPERVNYKHPLAMVFRPFASLFLLMGFAPKAAAVLVMALFGALTVALVYGFARLASIARPEATVATLLFGCSSTSLFTSIVVETYGWANFSIVLVWFLFMWSAATHQSASKSKFCAAVLVAGVTLTNGMHAVVAEFFTQLRSGNVRHALVRGILYGLAIGLGLLIMLAVLQPHELWSMVARPVQTVKEVYWLRTKGATSGLTELLLVFFGYSFFSPAFTKVALSPDAVMLDFRSFSYSSLEQLAVFAWWGFVLVGVVMIFTHQSTGYRRVAVPLLVVVFLNLLLHMQYQFRGSLYIYAAHLHFAIFALGIGAASWVSGQRWPMRTVYVGVLLALAVAALLINTQRAADFVVMFDTLVYPADDQAIRP